MRPHPVQIGQIPRDHHPAAGGEPEIGAVQGHGAARDRILDGQGGERLRLALGVDRGLADGEAIEAVPAIEGQARDLGGQAELRARHLGVLQDLIDLACRGALEHHEAARDDARIAAIEEQVVPPGILLLVGEGTALGHRRRALIRAQEVPLRGVVAEQRRGGRGRQTSRGPRAGPATVGS